MDARQSVKVSPDSEARPALRKLLSSPVLILSVALVLCAGLLTLPLIMPLGAMYWDLTLYLDAANRIAGGQQPLLDFLTPVGPLGYWLFAGLSDLFPQSQPLLLAQWSLLLVTAPPMFLILRAVDRTSRATALSLLLPFLVFQLLPINVEQYSFFPGLDGFGIYNRQVSIALYVLTAALVFLRERRLVVIILVWTMLALLFLKVTGFLAGGLIAFFALLAGRLELRQTLVAAGVACLALLTLELGSGMVSAYVESIVALIAINAGSILPRFLQAGSLHLDIVAAGSALVATLFWMDRAEIAASVARLLRERSWAALNHLLDRDAAWLSMVMAAGLFLETQNTGGQAFIFVWPVLLAILLRRIGTPGRGTLVVCTLVAATAILPLETVLQRAGRTLLAQINYEPIPHRHLERLGQVSQHPEVIARAQAMQALYAARPEIFQEIADKGMLPSQSLYSELDFQIGWLLAIDSGIAAILAHEAANGRRFETIMSLNFANPFPYLMQRTGVPHLPIGADPFRSVPEPDAETRAAIRSADLVLYPLCPITVANLALKDRYAEAMAGRREIALGTCWRGYVRD
jgi:hypothetical protein